MIIKDKETLRALYGEPGSRASKKIMARLDVHSKHFIRLSPFMMLATYDEQGRVDLSPRGGQPGFVLCPDDETLVIPDAKGNNRVDSLINIVETGRAASLFLLPGIDETLRINGAAHITTDDAVLDLFPEERYRLKSCIVLKVEEMFMHCAKALMRSQLWDSSRHTAREDFPSMGQILKDQLGMQGAAESHEDMVKRYQPDL